MYNFEEILERVRERKGEREREKKAFTKMLRFVIRGEPMKLSLEAISRG